MTERSEKIKQIKMTKDYDRFSFINSNRPIKPRKVRSLKASIQRKNLLNEFPITVNSKYEVLDGQHRLVAAKQLRVSIYYTISDKMTKEDISRVNASQDKWTLREYLNYYCLEDCHEYKVFKGFMGRYDFGITIAMIMLCGERGGQFIISFKEGDMKIRRSIREADEHASMVYDFSEYVNFYKARSFVLAMMELIYHPGYDHKRMMGKMEMASTKLVKCPDKESYMKVLESIYNYHASDKVRFI